MCFEEGKMLLNRFWQAMLCFLLTMMAIGRLATEKPGMRPLNLSKHARTHTQSFHIPLCHVVQRLHREVHPSLNHLHCIISQQVTSGGGVGAVKCSAVVCRRCSNMMLAQIYQPFGSNKLQSRH